MSHDTPKHAERVRVHYVKSVAPHFDNVWAGIKTFEIRLGLRSMS